MIAYIRALFGGGPTGDEVLTGDSPAATYPRQALLEIVNLESKNFSKLDVI
jgi:hypothetical protein